jgi:hypothetical protein
MLRSNGNHTALLGPSRPNGNVLYYLPKKTSNGTAQNPNVMAIKCIPFAK